MDAQIGFAQTLHRDEVHPLDQFAQFLPQVLAGLAFHRQMQVLCQVAVSLGDPGVETRRRRRDSIGK